MRGLGKRFGDLVAVKGVDLDVPAGSFFGLVGPNGAGKTTTLSMVTGLLRPEPARCSSPAPTLVRSGRRQATVGVLPDGLRLLRTALRPELLSYGPAPGAVTRGRVGARRELVAVLGLAEAQGSSSSITRPA